MQAGTEAIERAARVLREGGIVAVPTDTQYGLAALASHGAAIMRLFALKQRSDDQALPIFIPDQSWLDTVATHVSEDVRSLIDTIWPGGLTLVLRRNADWHSLAVPGETVAVRIPDHPIARTLLTAVAEPITGTSANRHGRPAAATPEAVGETFGDEVEILPPGDVTPQGQPSTILDCTGVDPHIVRGGIVGEEQIRAILARDPRVRNGA